MKMEIETLLNNKFKQYCTSSFIEKDPISIPHSYTKLQDIEITAFWSAILSWGNRTTIISKCNELFSLMDNAPHDFVINHSTNDLKKLLNFKHRTFNTTDTLYFIDFFKHYYNENESLETAFSKYISPEDENVKNGLIHFYINFFASNDAPNRTRKHIASPDKKSACKRLNMFLRWMVRNNQDGVDFGLWKNIKTSQLICPLDVHVDRVARKLGLLERKQSDWKSAEELTKNLKRFDANDPVKYDYALFMMGIDS
tara:strand:+ start:910 stop:1674 length:765 start_codon:yes stop_codon:yes gene_type:complete